MQRRTELLPDFTEHIIHLIHGGGLIKMRRKWLHP